MKKRSSSCAKIGRVNLKLLSKTKRKEHRCTPKPVGSSEQLGTLLFLLPKPKLGQPTQNRPETLDKLLNHALLTL